jgi:hypothetical protein
MKRDEADLATVTQAEEASTEIIPHSQKSNQFKTQRVFITNHIK